MSPQLRKAVYSWAMCLPIILGSLSNSGCVASAERVTIAEQSTKAVDNNATAQQDTVRWQSIANRVEIIRDDYGVPHVYGKSDTDAVFGLLYAQAEDDFARIERNYIWAIGRLAEVEGEKAIFSDLRARLYMTIPEAQAAYTQAPAWLQRLCDAFADGLNFYLATHPEVTPKLLTRFEPWMPMFFFEGSIGGDIEQVPLPRIEAFYDSVETPQPHPGVANSGMAAEHFTEPQGSNGFAIAPALSESGNALLLINPHTSFFFRGEVHVVSEEGLNAYGAVTWGQFFVYQGFNERTGWMHTSTRADFMDEFVQRIERDGDVLKYRYGSELRDVTVEEVSLQYRRADGSVASRTFPRYRTHQGPVTHALANNQWVTTRINWQPAKALAQSYTRMKQSGYTSFRRMMDERTNSSNNTVYADADGNIGYFHGNFMPRRDPTIDYSKPVDGSNPATDWQGLHPVEETVLLLNPDTGWLQNCNSTPFTAADTASPLPANYPPYMAPDAENHRGIHAVRLLKSVKAKVTAGDSTSKLTLDELIELAYDPQLPGFETLLAGLISAWDDLLDTDARRATLAPAIGLLRSWDLRVSANSRAMSVAHFYGVNMLETAAAPESLTRMERIDWLGVASKPEQRLQVLADTLDELKNKFGRWDTPWGEINRYQRLDGSIEQRFDDLAESIGVGMASGNWGALASFGAPRRDDVDRLYGRYGNSFVAVVEFGKRLKAKSLLAGGQSGNPESPHFADQSQRYADAQFKTVAFYKTDVEARSVRRYRPGSTPGKF